MGTNFPLSSPIIRFRLGVVVTAGLIGAMITLAPAGNASLRNAPATTLKKSTKTTKTTIKTTKTTTTVKKATKTPTTVKGVSKSSTTVADTTSPPKSGGPTTTLLAKPVGGSTTTVVPGKPGVKVTFYIPGAGRVLDLGAAETAKLAAGGKVEADVRGAAGLAAAGQGSVILDITSATPTVAGKVTVTPVSPDYARSIVSATAAFVAGPTTVTRLAVPIGKDGLVRIDTTPGPQGLAVNVVGWVVSAPSGTSEPSGTVLESCKLIDTVTGQGGLTGLVTQARPFDLPASNIGKVPAPTAAVPPSLVFVSVATNGATSPSELSVLPTNQLSPALLMSAAPGSSPAAVFAVPVGADPRVAFYVTSGSMNLSVEVIGWLDREGIAKGAGPC